MLLYPPPSPLPLVRSLPHEKPNRQLAACHAALAIHHPSRITADDVGGPFQTSSKLRLGVGHDPGPEPLLPNLASTPATVTATSTTPPPPPATATAAVHHKAKTRRHLSYEAGMRRDAVRVALILRVWLASLGVGTNTTAASPTGGRARVVDLCPG